jgi:hypothetical protein
LNCGDGVQDYALGLGSCDATRTTFSASLPLFGVPLPASGCLRKVGAQQGGTSMTIREVSLDSAQLSFTNVTETHRIPFAAWIPRHIPIPALTLGRTYTLVISATDGNTMPIEAETNFVYEGETQLVVNAAPRAVIHAAETRTTPPGTRPGQSAR